MHTHTGSQNAVLNRDNSSINTIAVSRIFCAKPKNTVAPTNAAAPAETGGNTAFQAAALANAIIPPSIIDGVIRPPYAPASEASSTAAHFVASSASAVCQVSASAKLN